MRNMTDPAMRAFWEKVEQRAEAFKRWAPAWLLGGQMSYEKPRAMTFFDDGAIEVEILAAPTSTGLVRCLAPGGKVIVRNKVQLNPINEAAKELLK
jgi:hypothetical protein